MKCCMNGGNVIRLLFLSVKLLKFEIQKCGQILCAHKPYFLMPGHILSVVHQKFNAREYAMPKSKHVAMKLRIICI